MYRVSTKLLATRFGGVLANRTTLSVAITALIIVGALAIQVVIMSSELQNGSNTIDLQNQEIQEYLATISTQKQEIDGKTAQLNELNAEIVAKSQKVDSLGAELVGLQDQAHGLQEDIALLQAKIESDEQHVSSLSKQLELTQESAKRVKISHYSLAVINSEIGVVFPIEVEIINSGTGAISVDVSNAQYEHTFQSAVRTAADVASEYTGESISDKDIVVRIINDQPDGELVTIDGSSAGALIAGMIVAGLDGKEVSDKVLVTGTINPNGTIGRVGSIGEKSEAALDFGASILLVPEAQEFDSNKIVVVGVLDIEDVVKYLVTSE